MPRDLPHPTATIAGHALHVILSSIPVTCFIGTLVTDVAYWATANMQWANFSAWLLTIGLIVSMFAVLAGLVDFFGDRRIRTEPVWLHSLGYALVLILSIINAFVHSRDAYTSVVPLGMALSAAVVVILAITGWVGWHMAYRHGEAPETGR
jgi:uncharacterized membrane protein